MTSTPKTPVKIVGSGLIGNVLEWYDFALYGYFAHTLSPLFFPTHNKLASLIAAFAVFAIGFLVRPIGAVFFGHLGDKYGRKKSLSLAILLMAIPTALIGCLPSFEQIGLLAPIALMILRLLQGLAVGGEFTSSMVYLLEHVHREKRGFYSGVIMASAFVGLLLGSAAAFITGLYINTYPELWRIPFLVSLLLGAIGLYLRLFMPESPSFIALKNNDKLKKLPFKTLLSQHKTPIVLGMALAALPSTGFYLSFVYLSNHLQLFLHKSLSTSLLINTITMSIIIITAPFFGRLADNWGHKTLLLYGAAAFTLLSIPSYLLINFGQLHIIFAIQLLFGLMVAASYAAIPIFLFALFPAEVRVSGVSLPYNLANGFIGGTSPLVATSLIYLTHNKVTPGIYLTVIALGAVFALFWTEKHKVIYTKDI